MDDPAPPHRAPPPQGNQGEGGARRGDDRAHHYGAALAKAIEAKWRARWEQAGTYLAPNPIGPLAEPNGELAAREAFYVLDMFPYPSGSGLHVGHPLGYIGTDVVARFG